MSDNRREFVKKILFGAAAAGATAFGGCGESSGEDSAMKSALSPNDANLIRLSMARTDLPVGVWEDILALSKLTEDVFRDPGVASAFAQDPRGYLDAIGMAHVQIDKDAIELRLATAMGDAELRSMAAEGRFAEFIDRLAQLGLLDESTRSPLAQKIGAELAQGLGVNSAQVSPQMVYAVPVLLVAVAVTWVAAAYSVVAGMMVGVGVAFATKWSVKGIEPLSNTLLKNAPGLGLAAAMAGAEAGRQAAVTYVDEVADGVVSILKASRAFMERNTMGDAELRRLVHSAIAVHASLPSGS